MRIHIETQLKQGRSGVAARAPSIRLTSHGLDEQEALESLRRGILAWCESLQSLGKLEKALKHNQVTWQSDDGPITVELNGMNYE